MTQIFGQLDHRSARNARTRNWLNAEEVRAGQANIPPDSQVNIPATVDLIRRTLQNSPTICIDVKADRNAVMLIRENLTPDENSRTEFSSR